jgi:6-phosphogluconate dehydrogenase
VDDYFRDAVVSGQNGWRRAMAGAGLHGVPVPGFSSALAYQDGIRAEPLPAALIQGQRDLFGAHKTAGATPTASSTWTGRETAASRRCDRATSGGQVRSYRARAKQ